jgi:hypothetical protein
VGWVENKLENIVTTVALEGERTRVEMAAGLAQTQRGLRIDGARYRTLPAGASSSQLVGAPCRLVGWSILAESQPVRLLLRDGRGTAGDVVTVIDLAAGESDNQTFGGSGVAFTDAMWVDITGTGTLTGSLYLGAVD